MTTVDLVPGTIAGPYAYAITDNAGVILDIVGKNKIDFAEASVGECRIYGVSWWGNFQRPIGSHIEEAVFADYCSEVSVNYVTVVRSLLGQGSVSSAQGDTIVYTCPGDDVADVIEFAYEGTSEGSFTYLITDTDYNILGVPDGNVQDFEGAGIGTCLVWGLNYDGDLLAEVGGNARNDQLSTGCSGLSMNYLKVVRSEPHAGSIVGSNGQDDIHLCVGDGQEDIESFLANEKSNANFRLVVTNDSNVIIGLPGELEVDFEGAGGGTCRVWGASFTGDFMLTEGQILEDAQIASGCYDVSPNYVSVVRTYVNGGTVFTIDSSSLQFTCPQDGKPDSIAFLSMNASETNFIYLITSPSLEILGFESGDAHDFDNAPPGTCWVWGLAYTGEITAQVGDYADEVGVADGCFDFSDNHIAIVRENPDGGTVSTVDGSAELFTCSQDDNPDVVEFAHQNASNTNYAYIITSPTLEILGVKTTNFHDFDDAPPGTCWVWGMAYTGELTAEVGLNAGSATLSTDCYDLSDNYITVHRSIPDGGTVSTFTGANSVFTCPQDGQGDFIPFAHKDQSNSKYAYIITSPSLEVLGVTEQEGHDFDDAPPGTCWVWGIAYTGNLLVQVGMNAGTDLLSDDCYDLSDNFIEVVREVPVGGVVQLAAGGDSTITCTQDGTADLIEFDREGASNSKYAYIITSPDLEILGIETDSLHDFDDAPAGTCWVWGLAYTGNLTAQVGENASEGGLSSDCFDLSENHLTIVREHPNGGMVSMPSGATKRYTCPEDGNPDLVEFVNTGVSGPNYAYIITSPDLEILGIKADSSHDFDAAPAGTCWVWGLAYVGSLTAQVGDTVGTVELTDGCYDLSENYIEVVRDNPEGGTVSMPDGGTSIYTCPQDGNPDVVEFVSAGASNAKYAYIITSPALEVLGIEYHDFHDFNDAPPGTCWVWGLSYTGTLAIQVGDTVGSIEISDDCYDLSDNYIEVIRDLTDGGTVSTPDGSTFISTCTLDGKADVVEFMNTGTSNAKYAYVITTPDLKILGIKTEENMHDFDAAPAGTCWVWGLSYTGKLLAVVGDDASDGNLSNDCYDLSDNYIEVRRELPDGGSVATDDGDTAVVIWVGTGKGSVVQFSYESGSNSAYAYIVTDEENVILAMPSGSSVDFDAAPPGVCRLWGVSYAGQLIAEPGDTLFHTAIADECYDLSDNYVAVTRVTQVLDAISQRTIPQTEVENSLDVTVHHASQSGLGFEVYSSNTLGFQVLLYDFSGRLIRSETYKTGTNRSNIDLNVSLAGGMHILSIVDGGERSVTKIFVP